MNYRVIVETEQDGIVSVSPTMSFQNAETLCVVAVSSGLDAYIEQAGEGKPDVDHWLKA